MDLLKLSHPLKNQNLLSVTKVFCQCSLSPRCCCVHDMYCVLYYIKLATQIFFLLAIFDSNQKVSTSGLSVNILHAGDKSPVQRGFFTNSMSDLLPTLRFLGELYNFCNFVITFSLI